jgi:ABC-type branched-subunit amino acid transport system ATPase component
METPLEFLMNWIVEQNTKQAAKIAHRIFVLEAGHIALESKKLLKKEIRKIYFGT